MVYELKFIPPDIRECDNCGNYGISLLEGEISDYSQELKIERWLCIRCLHRE